MQETHAGSGVKTTETSLQIIEVLMETGSIRIEELADRLDIAPSTAHRHLQTLRRFGYVVESSGDYRLGLQFLTVGGHVRASRNAYDLAHDAVVELTEQTKERVQFLVEEQGQRVYLYTETGENAVRANAKIGRRGPLHCSAAGKAILAKLPVPRVESIIEEHGLPRVTENTITDPDVLFEELEAIREVGYAFNREESTLGLHAVAAPVTEIGDGVIGALSVSGPAHRLDGKRFTEEIPDLVRGVAQELDLNIKYSN